MDNGERQQKQSPGLHAGVGKVQHRSRGGQQQQRLHSQPGCNKLSAASSGSGIYAQCIGQ